MRVVISLTTLPSRLIGNEIIDTLKSINNQTYLPNAIYLGIPKTNKRLDTKYPDIPNDIKMLCTTVDLDEDCGPVTKILAALKMESNMNTIIITIDDDVIYPNNLVEKMLEKHSQHKKCALGSTGFITGKFPGYGAFIKQGNWWFGPKLNKTGKKVDVLCGFSGILYIRNFFPKWDEINKFLEIPMEDKNIFYNDDIYISSWLNFKGHERRVFNLPKTENQNGGEGLSDDTVGFFFKFVNAWVSCKKKGLIKTQETIKIKYTIGGQVFNVILIILLIILIIWIIILFKRNFYFTNK